jgi:hypothetical protein
MSYAYTEKRSCIFHSNEWEILCSAGYTTQYIEEDGVTAVMIRQKNKEGELTTFTPKTSHIDFFSEILGSHR